jgi:hypothetical protein
MGEDGGSNIGEQGECEDAKHIPEKSVGGPDLGDQNDQPGDDHNHPDGKRNQEVQSGGHATYIRGGFDNIPDDYTGEHSQKKAARVTGPNYGEQTLSGNKAQLRGEIYNSHHHGKGDGRRPKE